ncbi:hypothetical protein TRFO_24292 [Tritrichomonas foetus]|uniref:Rad60/SUMO-like domain-containing protein n=1 Tax=Tritrichomonas foetus TaxID=1144522 RepID=A0A1J4K958_9EUKA|nr:hypothetical protein TRFO_24292 [Tritrichomonas foetus]|eukprot:OHT07474.1 hypothetical protein TRFO_24292 [Tritrichomonas foetus]
MSTYIDKAINEAKQTNKYVVVCIERLLGKGLLSNDEIFRAITLNFVPYTTSAGSPGCQNFLEKFTVKDDIQRYFIIDPNSGEIVATNEQQNLTQFELLKWMQDFLDQNTKNEKKGKTHQVGQRFPKPKAKQMKNCNNKEFKLTPQTQFQAVKNINIKFVTPDGAMHTCVVNKDKKISQFLRPKCKELNLNIDKLYFLFDARQFHLDQTVKSIHLQENSVVYANYKYKSKK